MKLEWNWNELEIHVILWRALNKKKLRTKLGYFRLATIIPQRFMKTFGLIVLDYKPEVFNI